MLFGLLAGGQWRGAIVCYRTLEVGSVGAWEVLDARDWRGHVAKPVPPLMIYVGEQCPVSVAFRGRE